MFVLLKQSAVTSYYRSYCRNTNTCKILEMSSYFLLTLSLFQVLAAQLEQEYKKVLNSDQVVVPLSSSSRDKVKSIGYRVGRDA